MRGVRGAGLTLVELIVTLAVAAILLTLAVPAYENFTANNRLTSEANRLLGDIQMARSEAVKRGRPVNICRSSRAATCKDTFASPCTCHTGTAAYDWSKGWLVYVSDTRDTNYSRTNPAHDLIKIGTPAAREVSMWSDSDINQWLSIGANGLLDEEGPGDIRLCYQGESTSTIPGREIVIDLTGRPSVSELSDGADCGEP